MQGGYLLGKSPHPEAQVFDLDFLLDLGPPAAQLPAPPSGGAKVARSLEHWPLDGASKIQTAARALVALADYARRARLPVARGERFHGNWFEPGGADLMSPAGMPGLCAEPAQAELERVKRTLIVLAHDYEAAGTWLATEMATTWQIPGANRSVNFFGPELAEYHRIFARAWLSTDMNRTVSRLLRRAIRALGQVDFARPALDQDGPQQSCEAGLDAVAGMLDCAGTLAKDYVLFMRELDRRWLALRQQIDKVVALSSDAGCLDGLERS